MSDRVIHSNVPATRPEAAITRRGERLRAEYQANVDAELSANTRRNYVCQWSRFVRWCIDNGHLPQPPVAVDVVLEYIIELNLEKKSVSTLRLALAAITQAHLVAGLETSPAQAALIKRQLRSMIKRRANDRELRVTPATAMSQDDLRKIGAVDDGRSSEIAARDRALLLVGFAAGLRRSELVGLDVSDVRDLADGSLDIYLYKSKTDQVGKGATVPVYPAVDAALCPVQAWRAWRAVYPDALGPAFVAVHKSGRPLRRRRLTGEMVARTVAAAMRRSGVLDGKWTGHSLRRGCVTNAVEHDVPLHEIADHVRHQQIQTTRGYIGSRSNKGMRNAMNPKKETQ